MQLKPEQLEANLQRQLLSLYFVTGDEPLQKQESCDAIRKACRAQGVSEREILRVDQHFDWGELQGSAAGMSLFGDRKLIELNMPSAKPGDKGSKALVQYVADANSDNVLLVISDKMDQASKRSKWFTALDSVGVIIQTWPIDERSLPRWIQQRLAPRGISIDSEALEMICDRVAGNLLAAVQEIDKLELLADNKHIDAALVTESVSDNARYNLFSTLDIALAGRSRDTIKMMRGLQAEGTEPTVVIWAVHRELNLLYRCREQLDRGEHINQVLNTHRVWSSRQSLVGAALQRLSCADLEQLFAAAVATDQTIKGMRQGDPWEKLTDLMLGLAGVSVLTPEAMTA